MEKHFWNVVIKDGSEYHIDLTWRQFPAGSSVRDYEIRDRETLGDGAETIRRVELLEKGFGSIWLRSLTIILGK